MKKVVIITNAPAPYRVAFFHYLQTTESNYQFHVIYTSQNENIGRAWQVSSEDLGSHSFLECKVITLKRRYDNKHIVISTGIQKQLSNLQPDIVICMEYNLTILQAVHWCQTHHVPFLSWSDGTSNSEKNINRLQLAFRHYVIRRAKGFISSSTATLEHQTALGANHKNCYKSLLTVDIDKYLQEKPASYIPGTSLLYVGSLIGRKGLDLLFPALALTDPKIELYIVGDGGEKDALLEQANLLGISNRIHFLGYLEGDALNACYQNFDAFILPTREDCFGLVMLEAMCASLPVIASKYADGAFDLITSEKYGSIVDPYDPQELANAITSLFSDPSVLAEKQHACYMHAKEFSFKNVSHAFYEALDSIQ